MGVEVSSTGIEAVEVNSLLDLLYVPILTPDIFWVLVAGIMVRSMFSIGLSPKLIAYEVVVPVPCIFWVGVYSLLTRIYVVVGTDTVVVEVVDVALDVVVPMVINVVVGIDMKVRERVLLPSVS